MFRSLLCGVGVNLRKRRTAIIYAESSASSSSSSSISAPPAKYLLFTLQNQNVGISNSRATSIVYSFSTTASNRNVTSDSDSSFVVSYLINSCGLSENQAITASNRVNFKTTSKPDSVLTLLKSYGFTESHISKLINKEPVILSYKPDKILKPKLDFLKSKGLYEHDLANFISSFPRLLMRGLEKDTAPSFDILRKLVQSDENVIKMMRRNSRILSIDQARRVKINVDHLRSEGVPETFIRKYLIQQPRTYTVNRFKENLEKVKEMGFDRLQTPFLIAVHTLATMTEVNWMKKIDLYKTWGWSEDQIQTSFRKASVCMKASEKKIMAVMNFLVNEMGYDSSCVAANPIVFTCSLQERIKPRCYVIKILVSRGLIKENISLSTLTTLVDKSFLEKYVKKFEQEVAGLMQVFEGKLDYQELLQI